MRKRLVISLVLTLALVLAFVVIPSIAGTFKPPNVKQVRSTFSDHSVHVTFGTVSFNIVRGSVYNCAHPEAQYNWNSCWLAAGGSLDSNELAALRALGGLGQVAGELGTATNSSPGGYQGTTNAATATAIIQSSWGRGYSCGSSTSSSGAGGLGQPQDLLPNEYAAALATAWANINQGEKNKLEKMAAELLGEGATASQIAAKAQALWLAGDATADPPIEAGFSSYDEWRATLKDEFGSDIKSKAEGSQHKAYTNYNTKTVVTTYVENPESYSGLQQQVQNTDYQGYTITGDVSWNIYNLSGVFWASPIVMNLKGDGKLQASKGNFRPHINQESDYDNMRLFDLFGNGFPQYVEWVGAEEGLLCVPHASGLIDGTCLFGDVDGSRNGFDKLNLYDPNSDQKIVGTELNPLRVWVDANRNAAPDKGEVFTCQELGITQINIVNDYGVGSFIQNGKTKVMWDWYPNVLTTEKLR